MTYDIHRRSEYTFTDGEQEALTKYLRRVRTQYSENTLRNRKASLVSWFDYLESQGVRVGAVDGIVVEDYVASCLDDDYAARTVRQRCYCISDYYQRMIKRDVFKLDENPVGQADGVERLEQTQIERHDTQEYLEKSEIEALLGVAQEHSQRCELIIRLFLSTGVRVSELVSIQLDDVDVDNRTIRIENAKIERYTDSEERTVYFDRETRNVLSKYLNVGRKGYLGSKGDYLIVSNEAERIGERRVSEIVRTVAGKAGIQEVMYRDKSGRKRRKVTPHLLRKTYAVQCVRSGMDISHLSKLLGHSEIETTIERYLKYTEQDRREAAMNHSPI